MTNKKPDIIGGGKKWLNALVGKVPPSQTAGTSLVQQEPKEIQEDSIANDIKMFKNIAEKGVGKIKVVINPFAKKGTESVKSTTKTVAGSVDNKFIKTTVRSFIIVFLAIILIFIASFLFKRLKEESGLLVENGTTPVTPVPYQEYKYSIYAQDPEILSLEEDIEILERELTGTDIKEDGINPPSLDWNVSF